MVEHSTGRVRIYPTIRRDLLAVGSHSAEFAGWLYRDLGNPVLADYWRGRSMEWAAEAGDLAMCGYVLLKKSQAAWDNSDTAKMLSPTQAAQQSTWQILLQVRAEAAQQEAHCHAMTGASQAKVEAKLDEAHTALTSADPTSDRTSTDQLIPGEHY